MMAAPAPLAVEPPPPRIWPSECFERAEPQPAAPVGVRPPASAPETVQRDFYEAVQDGYIDVLKAWGKTANERHDKCASAHRQ